VTPDLAVLKAVVLNYVAANNRAIDTGSTEDFRKLFTANCEPCVMNANDYDRYSSKHLSLSGGHSHSSGHQLIKARRRGGVVVFALKIDPSHLRNAQGKTVETIPAGEAPEIYFDINRVVDSWVITGSVVRPQ
jgi:hypothetical protein